VIACIWLFRSFYGNGKIVLPRSVERLGCPSVARDSKTVAQILSGRVDIFIVNVLLFTLVSCERTTAVVLGETPRRGQVTYVTFLCSLVIQFCPLFESPIVTTSRCHSVRLCSFQNIIEASPGLTQRVVSSSRLSLVGAIYIYQ